MFNLNPFKKNPYKELSKWLDKNQKPTIVILTGAGISAESGIATFRGQDGLWNGEKIEEVCRPEGFANDPKKVIDFYNKRRSDFLEKEIKPNKAHYALGMLEKHLEEVYIITQNVDNLHEKAGSQKLYHIHGSLFKNKCNDCGYIEKSKELIEFPNNCTKCHQNNLKRPDVVFFKESPYFMKEAQILANNATIFICIGTSGIVYPAAGLVRQAKAAGAITIQVNPDEKANDIFFDIIINDKASVAVPKLVEQLLDIYFR